MKHRRLAAAAAVAVLLSLQTVGNATADPTLSTLVPGDCYAYQATPGNDVPHAWHLDRLQMESAWGIATGKGVEVAVIDTGVATAGSPYFTDDRVKTFDFLDGKNEDDEEAGGMDCKHGTAVASLIGAALPDGRFVDGVRTNFAGVAPDAQIIAYRVLRVSERQEGKTDPLEPTIAAVRAATERGVDVINLSQSVSPSDPLSGQYQAAVTDALKAGIVVVAAAGNIAPNTPTTSYPGAFEGVIAVGNSTRTDAASESSLPGPNVALGAPGTDVMALLPSKNRENPAHTDQAYISGLTGTSYAAPIVSGVVALMLEQDPSLTPEEVKLQLEATADPPPAAVPDSQIGFGIVNPMRALAGIPRPQEGNPDADAHVPVRPLPTAEDQDMKPAVVAVSMGAGALVLASVGLVAAISIPAAARRNKSKS